MKVSVADLSEEARRLDFIEPAALLTETVAAAPGGAEQRFDEDVAITAEIYRVGTDVYLSGHLAGQVRATCPRCLDEFCGPLERDFRFLLVRTDPAVEVEPDQGVDGYAGDEIDLGPLVREQVLLALDPAARCSESCRGLCSGCGANLNREPCSCVRHKV